MTRDESPSGEATPEERTPATSAGGDGAGGRMRAREWVIAHRFRDPVDYGIAPLPEWEVSRRSDGGLALSARDEETAFIVADHPVTVRR